MKYPKIRKLLNLYIESRLVVAGTRDGEDKRVTVESGTFLCAYEMH